MMMMLAESRDVMVMTMRDYDDGDIEGNGDDYDDLNIMKVMTADKMACSGDGRSGVVMTIFCRPVERKCTCLPWWVKLEVMLHF